MSVNLGTAYVDVEPDFDNFHRKVAAAMPTLTRRMQGLTTSTDRAHTTTSRFATATAGLGSALGGAAVAAGAAVTAYLSISQAKTAISATADLAKVTAGLSRNLGLSTKAASRWGAVAYARDIDTRSLTMSFTTLSRQLTEASRGSDTAQQAFADIGITQRNLAQTNGNFQRQILLVADAFGDAEGGALRQQAAQRLLGRGYQTLLPLFAEGKKSLKEQLHWADKYGVTLDKHTTRSVMDFVSAQRESRVAWLGLQKNFSVAVLPFLTEAQKKFQRLSHIINNPKLNPEEKWDRAMRLVTHTVKEWGGKLLEVAWDIGSDLVSSLFKSIKTDLRANSDRYAVQLANEFIHILNAAGDKIFEVNPMMPGWLNDLLGGGVDIPDIPVPEWQDPNADPFGDLFDGSEAAAKKLKSVTETLERYYDTLDRSGKHTDKARSHMESYGKGTKDSSQLASRSLGDHALKADNYFDGIRGDLDKTKGKAGDYADGADKSFDKTSGSAKQMAKRTSSSVRDLANAVKGGMENIGENTNEALKAFNVKKLAFSFKTVGGAASDVAGAQKGAIVPGAGSGDTVPLHIGGQLAAMVEPGEQVSVLNRKATAAMMRINDRIPRFRDGGLVPHLAKGGMAAMLSLANAFDRADEPYSMGGGHGSFLTSPSAVDCSGAVSAILHAGGLLQGAPMDTIALAGWGKAAKGNEPLVVATRPIGGSGGHTVMSLNGRVFGTSGENPNAGAGWLSSSNPRDYVSGAVLRTMGVAGAPTEIARVLLKGPDGPLKSMGQKALDKARRAANTFLSRQVPAGVAGGGDLGSFKGDYTATWYGPRLDQLGSPVSGTGGLLTGQMAFAELGNGTQVSGALGDLPWNTRIGVTYKGKTIQVEKRDVGTGQVANPPNAIDLWETAAAQLPGFMAAGVDVVNVSGLQGGGIAGRDPAFGTFPGFKRDRYISQKEWDRLVHIAGMGRYGSHFRQFRKGVWAAKQWQEGALPRVGKMYRHARHQAQNPWGDHDVWTRGEGVPHLAGGGKPGKKGDGHVHVGPGRIDPAWKRFAHAQKIATRLKELIGERGKIARLDETIGRAETLAGLDSSPLGSDLSQREIARQIALNERLLETMVRARKLAHSGLRELHFPRGMSTTGVPAAQLKNLRGSLGSTLVDLTGLTGKGGRIFDTKMQLDTLRHTSSGSAAALDISGLRGVIEAARFGVFDGAFATGGKIKPGHWGVAGEQGPEIVRGPATVHPSGDALLAPRVEVHNSFDWDGFDLVVTTTVDGQLAKRERISHHRERQLVR